MVQVILRAGGKRAAVEMEEANAILQRFQATANDDNNEVIGVDLSCKQWKQTSLDQIEAFLSGVAKSVKYLLVDDIIAGLMTEEGLAVTEALANTFLESNLLHIDLSDNAMGPRGLGRVGALFQNSSLQRLSLNNCGLSAESMEQLKGYLKADDWRVAKSLTSLSLDKNMIGEEGGEIVGSFLPHCVNLEHFSYRGSRPQKRGSKGIAKGLLELTKKVDRPAIRHLAFNDCSFGNGEDDDEGGVIEFTQALAKCSQLQYLDMNESVLEANGMKLLVDALTKSGARLVDFFLYSNEIGPEGAEALSVWLVSQVETLRGLNLGINEIGDEGLSAVLAPFFAPTNVLEDLNLELNDLTDEGANTLLMASFPKLKRLNVDDNMDIEEEKKVELVAKYGKDVVFFGEDEDMDDLVSKMAGTSLG